MQKIFYKIINLSPNFSFLFFLFSFTFNLNKFMKKKKTQDPINNLILLDSA